MTYRPLLLLSALAALPNLAFAQGEARDLALDAFATEFYRHEVAETDEALSTAFAMVCARGYSPACSRKSWLDGDGRPSLEAAKGVLLPSCDADDPVACIVVGWAYEEEARAASGADANKLLKRAALNYKTHCDSGYAPACNDYARVLYDYPQLGADPRAAVKRWQDACYDGDGPSCNALAGLYADGGRKNSVRPSRSKAAEMAQKACELGDIAGCARDARMARDTLDADQLDSTFGDLCEKGHRDSCWSLARTYFDGIHPEPEEGRTFDLFDRACELGHARSCFEAGRHYGEGELTDDDKAASYYRKACELGAPSGCSAEVDMILAERVDMPIKQALPAFESACEQRESLPACARLAYALIDGMDVPRDAERGKDLLHRVCADAGDDPVACAQLGQVYEEGLGTDRDRTVASKYYRWACSAGHTESCMARGDLLVSDVGVRRDDHEALNMYHRACEGGIPEGCREAASILELATFVARDLARAAEFYDEGCNGGVASSCTGLGRVLETGPGGDPDMAGAREAYERALALDDLEARRRLSRLLWNGFGGKKDKKRAKSLASQACQNGDPVACRGPEAL